MSEPGRVCPLRYRYGPAAIASAVQRDVDVLYVVGGLYGNGPALDAVEALATAEQATLCFNGDFNWFDVDPARFADINRRVLGHDAIVGNVEAEFAADDEAAGCGCAYPESVDAAVVERSNAIHRRLKQTAAAAPAVRAALAGLPMVRRYRVADCRVGIVHGDAESLAGWRFDVAALDDPADATWRRAAFGLAEVDVFASTHTCLPALRRVSGAAGVSGGEGWIANNGATGMPNFVADDPGAPALCGLLTRVGRSPSPHPVVHEVRCGRAWLGLLPVRFDQDRWRAEFLAQWPAGSDAWSSYFERIVHGTRSGSAQAKGEAG